MCRIIKRIYTYIHIRRKKIIFTVDFIDLLYNCVCFSVVLISYEVPTYLNLTLVLGKHNI